MEVSSPSWVGSAEKKDGQQIGVSSIWELRRKLRKLVKKEAKRPVLRDRRVCIVKKHEVFQRQ